MKIKSDCIYCSNPLEFDSEDLGKTIICSVCRREIQLCSKPLSKRVNIRSKVVVFPNLCPHCMQAAHDSIGIQSSGTFAGYYIFYTKWKYAGIQVPFCPRFVRQFNTINHICNALILIFGAILFVLFLTKYYSTSAMILIGVLIGGIVWILFDNFGPDRWIKLLPSNGVGLQFVVERLEYAKELAALNNASVVDGN
jgi:hypothetical protein